MFITSSKINTSPVRVLRECSLLSLLRLLPLCG
jgi:hypothetical protein